MVLTSFAKVGVFLQLTQQLLLFYWHETSISSQQMLKKRWDFPILSVIVIGFITVVLLETRFKLVSTIVPKQYRTVGDGFSAQLVRILMPPLPSSEALLQKRKRFRKALRRGGGFHCLYKLPVYRCPLWSLISGRQHGLQRNYPKRRVSGQTAKGRKGLDKARSTEKYLMQLTNCWLIMGSEETR